MRQDQKIRETGEKKRENKEGNETIWGKEMEKI